jgi:DNA replicative helicase MCM subunit Mcm2 (Cdc46/Mcm family)
VDVYDVPPGEVRVGFSKLLSLFIPLGKENKLKLDLVRDLFSKKEFDELKSLLRSHKARFSEQSFNTTHAFFPDSKYLVLASNSINKRIKERVDFLNKRIISSEREKVFTKFSQFAEEKILSLIAPDIIGMDAVKKAALLQLFASEKVHILLLGDPSTGKTAVLRSVADLAPISSFGLGSGSSKAGLTIAFSGKELVKGILAQADKGIACIDELNLLKNIDRAGLLNSMEKGVITYDKGNNHVQVDARVKIFASANPEGDKFVGSTMEVLRNQVPFEQALLSRFHLVFLIRRPSTEEFLKITDNIIRGEKKVFNPEDIAFVKEYIHYSLEKEVIFDKSLSPMIQGFIEDARKDEDKFLVEISPRMVIGIINMAKASARMRLALKVDKSDIIKVLKIFNEALYVKRGSR